MKEHLLVVDGDLCSIYDPNTFQCLGTQKLGKEESSSVKCKTQDNLLVMFSGEKRLVEVFDVILSCEETVLPIFKFTLGEKIGSIMVYNVFFIVGTASGQLLVWRIDTGFLIGHVRLGHCIKDIKMTENQLLLILSASGHIYLYSFYDLIDSRGSTNHVYMIPNTDFGETVGIELFSSSFHRKYFASYSRYGIRIISLEGGRVISEIECVGVVTICIDSLNTTMFVGKSDGSIDVFTLTSDTPKTLCVLEGHEHAITSLKLSFDDFLLFSADGVCMSIWNTRTQTILKTMTISCQGFFCILLPTHKESRPKVRSFKKSLSEGHERCNPMVSRRQNNTGFVLEHLPLESNLFVKKTPLKEGYRGGENLEIFGKIIYKSIISRL